VGLTRRARSSTSRSRAPTTRSLLSLAGSAFGVLAAEPLYVLVDTAVVGHLGSTPLAALGVGAALMTLVVFVATFVEYGTTARAARWFGAGDESSAVNEGVQATWLAALLGVVIVLVSEVFAGPLTRTLAGDSGAVQHAAIGWFRIAVIGIPGALIVLAGNGWMRGVQQVRAPVVIVLAANGLSAAASPILVYPLHLGLNGSAIANVGAQAVAATWFLASLSKSARSRAEKAGRWWRLQWSIMRAQLRLGRDLVLRSAGFQAAFICAAAVAARMGTAQLGAHQVALQLWEFSALVLDSFAIAAQSLVGAALGGGDAAAARHFAWQTARYGLVAGVIFGLFLLAMWRLLPEAFTSSAPVRHQLHILWPWFVGMQPFAGMLFALDGVLIGAGDVAFLRTITLIAAIGVFVPLNLAALAWHWGIGGVWAGLCGFVAARLIGMLIRTRGDRWIVTGATR
jgi:putative MATE family efflux protein